MRRTPRTTSATIGFTTLVLLGSVTTATAANQPSTNSVAPDWSDSQIASQTPAELAQQAPVNGPATVNILTVHNGNPTIEQHPVSSRSEAEDVIEGAQNNPTAVAAAVDTQVSIAPDLTTPLSNDEYRSDQWGLDQLKAELVWPITTATNITVAVVDTGVEGSHADLNGQVLPGADLVKGSLETGFGPVTGDENGHGTHVAGIIAGIAGNGFGIAGLAPNAQILPVTVLNATGNGLISDAAEGVLYAAQNGADVINLSLGTSADDPVLKAAVDFALTQGSIVIAAVGNSRTEGSPIKYPAAYPGVIGVAAIDKTGSSAWYSNIGNYVDIAAPGSQIISTYKDGLYAAMSGTSMAGPFVAATAALLVSAAPSQLSPTQISETLQKTAVDAETTGWDEKTGHGIINPRAAICSVTTACPEPSQ